MALIARRRLVLFCGPLLVIAAIARIAALPFQTVDTRLYLVPWVRHAEAAGANYLATSFTNYAPAYEHALALIALFPGDPLTRVKAFSILFDLLLALSVAQLVPRPRRPIAFAVTLILPSIVINSALIGQSDAIYATVIMLAIAAAIARRPVLTMLLFSTAIAIKLQAVFFLPVLVPLWLERRQPLWTFALIPAAYILFALPMIAAGRPIAQLMHIYAGQFDTFHVLSANAPNIWFVLQPHIPYDAGVAIGLPFACAVIGVMTILLWRSGIARDREGLLLCAAILLIAAPYFTPKMHDRFFFLASPLLVALACTSRKYLLPLVLAETASASSYFPFLALDNRAAPSVLGEHGVIQHIFPFSYALLPAWGALMMVIALILLIGRAYALYSERQKDLGAGIDQYLPHTKRDDSA